MNNINETLEPRWIEADESPWNIRVFDCRAVATTMASTLTQSDSAEEFMAMRQSDGSHLFGKRPENPVRIDVQMAYPGDARELPDRGMICQARVLEEKWDIAIDDGIAVFARSWTGAVVYCCDLQRVSGQYMVSSVVVSEDAIDDNDVFYHVHVVNYLLFSHVFDMVYPHPLPLNEELSEDDILMSSFSAFGNRGWFATLERFGEAIPDEA